MTATTAIGFVPAAPLLVPQVAGGSAYLDDELRDACRDVARRLTTSTHGAITVVAPIAHGVSWPARATWGFEGFGVPRRPPDPRPRLPWPIGIGDWLLDDVGWSGARSYVGVTGDATSTGSTDLGEALLVVGDGSARRTERAPGHLDDRAASFDASIATAIRSGDLAALGGLDAMLAAELLCAGAPVWRWLAATVDAPAVSGSALLVDAAPYGVGYFVGWWRLE
ncbi:MAG TPA: hypothetical protein VHE57_06540 [Mycobacteriales bacterium]|nr:hypothetical protein [Mycobacteriales bacterium]